MPANKRKDGSIPLLGSERTLLPGARVSGRLDPKEQMRATIIIKPRSHEKQTSIIEELGSHSPMKRSVLTREECDRAFGASPEDIAKVEAFARSFSLDVVEESQARRSVVLSGTVEQFSRAFNVRLARYRHPRGVFRGRTGPIYLPADLVPRVQAVLGLDNRPQAKAHFRVAKKRAAGAISYYPLQVAQLYDFPAGLDGTGQSVAIVELGGGYASQDIQEYFSGQGLPVPSVLSISVDGATNSPTGSTSGPDTEVMLDIEVMGSAAPKAQIYVYFAPNTDAGFVDAVSTAVHDMQHVPSIVSISWGDAESSWTPQGAQALDQAFMDAATVGVTVLAAAGDGGSSDGVSDGLAHVDFPASSQYVLGCGGTQLTSSGAGGISNEVVWNDQPSGGATGGGISDVYPLPTWQDRANIPSSANPGGRVGRGVPDVAGDADPSTGYTVLVDGQTITVGGTSAVAPLWSGLLARLNQKLGRPAGFLNPLIYGLSSPDATDFRDVVSGNNGAYKAGPGWDACSGWGSPHGASLLSALSSSG